MPYRSSRVETPKRTAEPGIVDDMIRQFADRYAFMRELVQNGIDAGATRLEVRIERDPTGGVSTSIDDDGCGMTRAVIEGPLLTLFSSSKEKDTSKIGKYGVGFVSVFAVEPERVEIHTRSNDEGWLLRLFGDHSYELSADAGARRGTVVSLVHTMSLEDFGKHVELATAALLKWCRHASVPITVVSVDAGSGGVGARTLAINEPMSVPGRVTASFEQDGERIVVGVGDASIESSFVGFYNRGLTLFEATAAEEGLAGVRFKVDSPRLTHTLSRDNVRRDGELRRVLDRVRELVRGPLAREVSARITAAAAPDGTVEPYCALLHAASVPALEMVRARGALALPLLEGGTIAIESACERSSGALLVADAPSRLTRALMNAGRPVVRYTQSMTALRVFTGDTEVVHAERAVSFATAVVDGHPTDDALVSELAKLLKKAGRSFDQLRLGTFLGVGNTEPLRVVPGRVEEAITQPRAVLDRTRPWARSATVFVNVDAPAARLARRRAKSDVLVAAHLLCRALLVADGPLDAKVVDRLLEAAGD